MIKKISLLASLLAVLVFVLMLTNSCKKDENNSPTTGIVTDIDGNVYKTVKIGNQWWMAENLSVTKYQDGTPIPNKTDTNEWGNLTTGVYCDYDNTAINSTIYGKLYNWYAVNDSRKIAPTGWHVPTDAEWTTLTTFLGSVFVAGGKLKETGTTHWVSPNTGASNETGFTGLPGGYRNFSGEFRHVGSYGYWWSSTEFNSNIAYFRYMDYSTSNVSSYNFNKVIGFSVRCIKD